MFDSSLNPVDLLESIQESGAVKKLTEDKEYIEGVIDDLSKLSKGELTTAWKKLDPNSKTTPTSIRKDLIDDIMAAKYGEEYNNYLKDEVGLKEVDTGVKKVLGTMQPQEKPDIDPEDYNMEDGEKEPDKIKQDTITEVPDKDLEQIIDRTNEGIPSMFIPDKIEILKDKMGRLKDQAGQLKKQQYKTKKSTRGFSLQTLYAKIDSLEKEIAGLQKSMGESKVDKAIPEFERKQLYVCNNCAKTFRNIICECVYCGSKNVEKIGIIEGQSDNLTVDTEEVKSELEEQGENNYKVVAKGIADKDTADELAADKNGVVITDDTDEEKFAVIVREDNIVKRVIRVQGVSPQKALESKDPVSRLKKQKTSLEKEMMEVENQYRKDMDRLGTAIDSVNQELKGENKE